MNEVVNSGVLNFASLIVSVGVLIVGLVLWFFINRASSRTNEQIELLEALLDQQKRQNALLRRLCEANEPEKWLRRRRRPMSRKRTTTSSVWLQSVNLLVNRKRMDWRPVGLSFWSLSCTQLVQLHTPSLYPFLPDAFRRLLSAHT